jgi:L-fuconolactonase
MAMIDAGLRFDALVQPRHLPVLLKLCARHPGLKLVIDHAAKPAIAAGGWQPWADDVSLVARETPAMCKLSGIVTEASPGWRIDDLRPYFGHLLSCFGPDRLMWGSDWPVVELAGGYARWREASAALLAPLSVEERNAIFGGTALRFYDLSKDAL